MHKEGCRLTDLPLPSTSLIIDMDQQGAPVSQIEQRCDYLLITDLGPTETDALLFCPVEMKRTIDTKALKQLRAGTKIGERMLAACQAPVRFFPVCVYRKGMNRYIKRFFKENPIVFKHRGATISKNVKPVKSGSSLQQELAKSPA